MKFTAVTAAALASVAAVSAQSSNGTICDRYSQALLNSTEGMAQATLLTLVVNSALIGNYSNNTAANAAVKPTGILTQNGTYNGTSGINLLKYFDGSLLSTNRNGMASSVNFLDGGGADPLKQNKAANNDSSNQYTLVSHLYSYFGYLLGCSSLGQNGFPAYAGSTSQASVHKYMNLSPAEMGYFIQEVAYSALSFGVTMEDVQTVGTALGSTFNNKCGAPVAVPANATPASQSICLDPSCPLAANASCNADNTGTNGTAAAVATSSSSGSSSGSSSASGSSASGSSSGSSGSSTGSGSGAGKTVAGGVAAAGLLGAAIGVATFL